ncbi:hypothetical protein SISNIDRAFT_469666 [Sistotremastrum niveocremeum HHB9708]|uniref:DUF6535 domain-containing protein n=1 Tax=Sistotremastrum niveocremeum HHB9708 TaxID=1314777 RepID=A0A164PR40_9AGAM|nr:hypothetical protein SISNIDRAFT_469666 [Sistotremastrum niveocremeum HHB9708]
MSTPPEPPHPPSLTSESPISASQAPASSSAPTIDPFDTPLFNRLIGLIEELSVTVKEQRNALEEQKEVLKEQTEVMKDMRRALEDHGKSTTRDIPNDVEEDSHDSGFAKPIAPEEVPLPDDDRPSLLFDEMPMWTQVVRASTMGPDDRDVGHTEDHRAEESAELRVDAGIVSNPGGDPGIEITAETAKDPIYETLSSLSKTMETVKDTLIAHGKKFDILTRDAEKDDQPYDQKAIDDEATCTALFEMAMTKTKEEVDEWIKRMDVSLVFIALFSAVLTAFLVPAVQSLSPSTSAPDSTTISPPPLPDISAQNVCVLFYLALILSILDAVLSVLGRQWMSKLTNRPEGSTYRERLLRHLERERLAKRLLRYLVEGLHVILLWSIGLFVTGLLCQLWNLGVSFDEHAPRLLAAWGLGIILSLGILGTVMSATMHALLYEVSPFGGPFSKLLLKIIKLLSKLSNIVTDRLLNLTKWLDECGGWIPWGPIIGVVVFLTMAPLLLSYLLIEDWRVNFDTKDKEKLVGAFMDLIAEASDPKLLERAVGSFSYVEWFEDREVTADQLEKTENRLMATDTSVRVRETLRARFTRFVTYTQGNWKTMGPKLTKGLVQALLEFQSYPEQFRKEFLSTSFRQDNADLRGLSALPFEEFVARVLCSYNHQGKLGDRMKVFHLAQKHCRNLLREGKEDDVTRILSHVDRLDLIKSFIQFPHGSIYSSLVEFIVKDRKPEILRGINDFVKIVDQSRLGSFSLSKVFLILASPPPPDVDLSPLIDYFSSRPVYGTWRQTSDAIIRYLASFSVSQLSDPSTVRRFLKQCVDEFCDEGGGWCFTSDENRARAHDLLAELDSLASPPTGAIASTSIQTASPSHNPTPNDSPQPDPLVPHPADSPAAPAPENVEVHALTLADPNSDMNNPMLVLDHPPPIISSSESEFEPPMAADSRAAFDHSPALENAHNKD